MHTKSSYGLQVFNNKGNPEDILVPYHNITLSDDVLEEELNISVDFVSLLHQPRDMAIVNAANCAMRGGGGIDGAIHKSAGPELLDALEKEAPEGCLTGDLVVTPGFATGFEYIFHTPGPQWKGGDFNEKDLLSSCYWNCLNEANMRRVSQIGFCSISTGIYGYPLKDAADVAMQTLVEYLTSAIDDVGFCNLKYIVFSMYAEDEYEAFVASLLKIVKPWADERNAKQQPIWRKAKQVLNWKEKEIFGF